MTEAFLYYLWRYQLLQNPLHTVDGEEITILKTGLLNSDSGPDFFNATIKMGETIWVGNVEIHVKSSDWEKHGHQHNGAYNNTILHVVFECDKDCYTQNGVMLRCLELKDHFNSQIYYKYEYLLHNKNWIPCANNLSEISDFEWKNWLERLAIERLENKSEFVDELLKSTTNDWEKAFFISIAGYFGQKINKLPFQILARSIDLNIIARHKGQLIQIEALLFGQAGLLDAETGDTYHSQLKKEYEFLSKKYKLVSMPAHLWKYMRLRPAAFPDVRISQLAHLLNKTDFLFSKMLETESLEQMNQLFSATASDFWDSHYRFDVPSPIKPKKLGENSREGILINSVIPFLFVYGRHKGEPKFEERAIEFLSKTAPEENQISKKFGELGFTAQSALESQAMLELKNNYCEFKKCLDCKVGMTLLNKLEKR